MEKKEAGCNSEKKEGRIYEEIKTGVGAAMIMWMTGRAAVGATTMYVRVGEGLVDDPPEEAVARLRWWPIGMHKFGVWYRFEGEEEPWPLGDMLISIGVGIVTTTWQHRILLILICIITIGVE